MSSEETKKRSGFLFPVIGLLVGISLFWFAWDMAHKEREAPEVTIKAPLIEPSEQVKAKRDPIAFYQKGISPFIDGEVQRNQTAATQAIASLRLEIRRLHAGIEPFVEDITGWGTYFGIIGKGAGDLWDKWWNNKENPQKLAAYTGNKFREHILSEEKLTALVQNTIQQFHSDLIANRNRLYSEVKILFDAIGEPIDLNKISFDEFLEKVETNSQKMAKNIGTDAVKITTAAVFAGYISEKVIQQMATQIVVKTASSPAISALLSSSAALVGGTSGAVIGSPISPGAGTIIGAGVGIAIGIIVDWWMTAQFKEKIIEQCTQYLVNLENALINGSGDTLGFRKIFAEVNQTLEQSQRDSFIAAITEVSK